MIIEKKLNDSTLTLLMAGKLNAEFSNYFEEEIRDIPNDPAIRKVILDFSNLDYIASSGLRVLIKFQKLLVPNEKTLVLKNVCENVMDIFNITGLTSVFAFEA